MILSVIVNSLSSSSLQAFKNGAQTERMLERDPELSTSVLIREISDESISGQILLTHFIRSKDGESTKISRGFLSHLVHQTSLCTITRLIFAFLNEGNAASNLALEYTILF